MLEMLLIVLLVLALAGGGFGYGRYGDAGAAQNAGSRVGDRPSGSPVLVTFAAGV